MLNKIHLLDDLDIYLIKEIHERETTGTRILAKDYFFKDVNEKHLWRKLDSKDMLVNIRLKNMAKLGLVIVERKDNGMGRTRNEYSLNLKNVIIRKFKFPTKRTLAILIKINEKWCIFELD